MGVAVKLATGAELTATVVVPPKLGHPPKVIETEYVPALAAVAFGMVGFCWFDVNPFGPDQLYVAPVTVGVDKLMVELTHIGLLLEAVGVAGPVLTVTLVVVALLVQPFTVIAKE